MSKGFYTKQDFKDHENIVYWLMRGFKQMPEYWDIIQQLNMEMIKAIGRYDPNGPAKLSTFLIKSLFWTRKRLVQQATDRRAKLSTLESVPEGAILYEDNHAECMDSVVKAVDKLPKRQAFVVRHMYGIGGYPLKSREEVAEALGISTQAVSDIRIKAIKKLKFPLKDVHEELS